MITVNLKTSLTKATMLTLAAGAILAGCPGCGSKTSAADDKAQATVPKDVMQKTYQDKAGRPSQ